MPTHPYPSTSPDESRTGQPDAIADDSTSDMQLLVNAIVEGPLFRGVDVLRFFER